MNIFLRYAVTVCVSEASVLTDTGDGDCAVCGLGVFYYGDSSWRSSTVSAGPRLQCVHHQHVPLSAH